MRSSNNQAVFIASLSLVTAVIGVLPSLLLSLLDLFKISSKISFKFLSKIASKFALSFNSFKSITIFNQLDLSNLSATLSNSLTTTSRLVPVAGVIL